MGLKDFFKRRKVTPNDPDPNCEDKFEVLVGKKDYCRHQEKALEAEARAALANQFVDWLSDLKLYVDKQIKPVVQMGRDIETYMDKRLRDAQGLIDYPEIREGQKQAREDTIYRAEDVWGLDYAIHSDGLYPHGNQIGRAPFRPGMTRAEKFSALVMPETVGGEWRTVVAADGNGNFSKGTSMALGTDENGEIGRPTAAFQNEIAAGGYDSWLDFIVDEDLYIIHQGFENREAVPTITEFQFQLSGVHLPPHGLRYSYNNLEERHETWLDIPNVISPKSQAVYKARSSRTGLDGGSGGATINLNDPSFDPSVCIAERFGVIGEVIAKRSFLIRRTY